MNGVLYVNMAITPRQHKLEDKLQVELGKLYKKSVDLVIIFWSRFLIQKWS